MAYWVQAERRHAPHLRHQADGMHHPASWQEHQFPEVSASVAHHLTALYVPYHDTGRATGFSHSQAQFCIHCASCISWQYVGVFHFLRTALPFTASCKLACALQADGWQASLPCHAASMHRIAWHASQYCTASIVVVLDLQRKSA